MILKLGDTPNVCIPMFDIAFKWLLVVVHFWHVTRLFWYDVSCLMHYISVWTVWTQKKKRYSLKVAQSKKKSFQLKSPNKRWQISRASFLGGKCSEEWFGTFFGEMSQYEKPSEIKPPLLQTTLDTPSKVLFKQHTNRTEEFFVPKGNFFIMCTT